MRTLAGLSDNVLKDLFVWVLPALTVPVLRYAQDTTNPNRKTLLYRDFISHGVGATCFLFTKHVIKKILQNSKIPRHDVVGTFIGALVNIAFASAGVVKLSRITNKKFNPSFSKAVLPITPKTTIAPFKVGPVFQQLGTKTLLPSTFTSPIRSPLVRL